MNGYIEIDRDDYRVLHPRPAYLIVTRKHGGGYNVMAASWVMPVSEEPPIIAIAIDKSSYTHELIEETGEFTVNVVGEEHADIVYRAGTISGRETDKWAQLGLKPAGPKEISTPGIDGSYGFLECCVVERVDAGECSLFIAEIKAIHVRGDLYTKYGWDLRKARILMHASGRAFILPGRLVLASKRRK